MTPREFIEKAARTKPDSYSFTPTGDVTPRIEHAIFGIVSEAGECMDALKKAKIHGKPLDKTNLVEEVGDIMWYMALLADELGVSFEQIWEKNIAKLQLRYPEKYSNDLSDNRDLEAERAILEQ